MELDSDMAQVVWLSENSIPVTKENAELIPYIMVAPDYNQILQESVQRIRSGRRGGI